MADHKSAGTPDVLERRNKSGSATWLEIATEFAQETIENGPSAYISPETAEAVAQVTLALITRLAHAEREGSNYDGSPNQVSGIANQSPQPPSPAPRESEGLAKMPNPTDADLADPLFEAIWQATKTWDVNAPEYYVGYCGMNGSHVMLILNALRARSGDRDAERYRWLRDRTCVSGGSFRCFEADKLQLVKGNDLTGSQRLDSAIDAAISQQGSQTGGES